MSGFNEAAFARFYGEKIEVSQIEWDKLQTLARACEVDDRFLIDLAYADWRQWRLEHFRLCDERHKADDAEKAA